MMKRLTALLCAVMLLFSCTALCVSAGVSANPRVVDKADVLTDTQEAELTSKLNSYSEKLGCDIVFLTEPDLYQEDFYFDGSVMDFADEYYDTNGYDPDGVLVLIVFDDGYGSRQIYVSTSGKCIKRLTDDEREEIFDDVFFDLRGGAYYKAYSTIADELVEKMSVSLKWYMLPLAIAIGFLIAILIMLGLKSKLKSVQMQRGAASYVRPGSMHLLASRDTYLYSTVSKTERESRSSGGGSSSHTSSGGGTHGGGGRSF